MAAQDAVAYLGRVNGIIERSTWATAFNRA